MHGQQIFTRQRMETSETSTDSVSFSCVFIAEAARPVGRAWSCDVARVMGVAGGTPGSGPITRCRVLSTKDTMDRTCDTCHGDNHTCKYCLCQGINLPDRQVPAYASNTCKQSKEDASTACCKGCSWTIMQANAASQSGNLSSPGSKEAVAMKQDAYLHPHDSQCCAETGGPRSCRKREDLLGQLSIDGRHLGQRHQREGWHATCLAPQECVASFMPQIGPHATASAFACSITV